MPADYRSSHLEKGADYDAGLAQDAFDAYMARREREILLRVVPRLFPHGIPRYLDFACGTGRITSLLETYAGESYGIDLSESMLAQARRRCSRSSFVVGDITREPCALSRFNLITAFRFFGNAQDELRSAVLGKLHALLADDGYLILNDHRNPWSTRNLVARLHGEQPDVDLSHRKLHRLLEDSGFRARRTHGIGFWIVRDKINQQRVLESRLASWLEPLSRLPLFGTLCPDAVIVATKRPLGGRD